jgi:hypothetical protein
VNDDGGGAFADLGGVEGTVAALDQATGDRQQATEEQRIADSVKRIGSGDASFPELPAMGI